MQKLSLEQAKNIKLFNRVETKYKCTKEEFNSLSAYLYDNYYVVSDNDKELFSYMSMYVDSPDLHMFNEHDKDIQCRQKMRIREYSNGEKYLEIKTKNEEGQTIKKRIFIGNTDIFSKIDWVKENLKYNLIDIIPVLGVKYNRITFVNKDYHERITVDFDIEFSNLINFANKKIEDVIIEVKQDSNYSNDAVKNIFKEHGIHECRFSKYYNGLKLTK